MSSQKRGCRIKLPLITALALLIVLSAVNVQIVGDPLTALTRHELTFEEFVDTVGGGHGGVAPPPDEKAGIKNNYFHKHFYFNLNYSHLRDKDQWRGKGSV